MAIRASIFAPRQCTSQCRRKMDSSSRSMPQTAYIARRATSPTRTRLSIGWYRKAAGGRITRGCEIAFALQEIAQGNHATKLIWKQAVDVNLRRGANVDFAVGDGWHNEFDG